VQDGTINIEEKGTDEEVDDNEHPLSPISHAQAAGGTVPTHELQREPQITEDLSKIEPADQQTIHALMIRQTFDMSLEELAERLHLKRHQMEEGHRQHEGVKLESD